MITKLTFMSSWMHYFWFFKTKIGIVVISLMQLELSVNFPFWANMFVFSMFYILWSYSWHRSLVTSSPWIRKWVEGVFCNELEDHILLCLPPRCQLISSRMAFSVIGLPSVSCDHHFPHHSQPHVSFTWTFLTSNHTFPFSTVEDQTVLTMLGVLS